MPSANASKSSRSPLSTTQAHLFSLSLLADEAPDCMPCLQCHTLQTSQAQVNFLKNVTFSFLRVCIQDEIHVPACYQNPSKIGMTLRLLQAYPV